MMEAKSSGNPVFGPPQSMFVNTSITGSSVFIRGYSRARKSFVGLKPQGTGTAETSLSLIVNWPRLTEN